MPSRLCLTPTCPHPAKSRGRCATHARERERQINRAGKTVYNSAKWKNTRSRVLFEEPLCRCGCGRLSTDVDHILPLAKGGAPFSRSNLQGLTSECHGQKTKREQGATA